MTVATSSSSSHHPERQPPLKQKMALGLKSLLGSARRFATGEEPSTVPDMASLFAPTDPAVDGADCTHDCESCHVSYPRGFKVETADLLYGHVKAGAPMSLLPPANQTGCAMSRMKRAV